MQNPNEPTNREQSEQLSATETPRPASSDTASEQNALDDGAATRTQERPPSCRDLVGLLAQEDRRSAYAALVLGAFTVTEVAERTGLRSTAAAMALQKLTEGRIASHDPDQGTYSLIDETFRLAVREEVRLTGRDGGDGAGAYFRKGRLASIPGNAKIRNRVLTVVAESFEKGATYDEPKVNAICGGWLDDWVSLRRALVDEGLLTRDSTARYARA
ncbi:DUF2087 domain-containing protein (plasmid) [Streptomyces cavourensis]